MKIIFDNPGVELYMWFVFLLCVIAAFADIIGGALTVIWPLNERQAMLITSLGAGFLLGATVLDRLPDAMHAAPSTAPVYMLIGYLGLLLMERYGASRHVHTHAHMHVAGRGHSGLATAITPELQTERDVAAETSAHPGNRQMIHPRAALISFVGLLFHTFMDGVVIAGSFAVSESTGILIFIAITLHKIPEGFSMASISLAAGTSRQRAFLTAFGLAFSTLVGAAVTLSLGSIGESSVAVLMALATGTFLYVSTTDMIPAIRDRGTAAILPIIIGVALFYVSLQLIQRVGLH
ncbi:MAG: ZIP family metal transporter [Alicyclobacillus herbarius]|uniref:ZIP family metal transporter n=1 Tax=Alicyclobacillus herbarius TaxID=122960 RepID=UPI002357BCA7|nr:ZIP family metal transporter [Alicyclobacillus herbarius]MCL6632500.1 ZIP family metal transporter [Alicyclobacillus herbarius]